MTSGWYAIGLKNKIRGTLFVRSLFSAMLVSFPSVDTFNSSVVDGGESHGPH